MQLMRLKKIDKSVFGVIIINKIIFYTLENENFIISADSYMLKIYQSVKFNKLLPMLVDVKDRTHILIHGGNKKEDSQGCILIGRKINLQDCFISDCSGITSYINKLIIEKIETKIKIYDFTNITNEEIKL
jgi:hypothetical protein